MINIMLEPIQNMVAEFLIIVMLFAVVGIIFKKLAKSIPGQVILLVFFIGMVLQPSTYTNIFISVLQMAP